MNLADEDATPNKLDQHMQVKSPDHILSRHSSQQQSADETADQQQQQQAQREETVTLWKCWNCRLTENEMDAACSKCGKDLAAFLGDDFTSILVERKRAVVNCGSSKPSAA